VTIRSRRASGRRTALAEGIAGMVRQERCCTAQRLHVEGHQCAVDAVLAGHHAVVLAPSRERRQRFTPNHCSAPQIPSGVPCQGLRQPGTKHGPGPPNSCAGTTSSTTTAHHATSARPNATMGVTSPSWPRPPRAVQRPGKRNQHKLVRRHTRLVACRRRQPSTQNATRSSPRSEEAKIGSRGCMRKATTPLTRAATRGSPCGHQKRR